MIFKVLQLAPLLYVWKCCRLTKVPFLSPSCAVLMPPVCAYLAAIGLGQWFISHLFAVWKAPHRCWMLCFLLLIALTHEAVKHMLMDQIKLLHTLTLTKHARWRARVSACFVQWCSCQPVTSVASCACKIVGALKNSSPSPFVHLGTKLILQVIPS